MGHYLAVWNKSISNMCITDGKGQEGGSTREEDVAQIHEGSKDLGVW